jgi:hypothetical protein
MTARGELGSPLSRPSAYSQPVARVSDSNIEDDDVVVRNVFSTRTISRNVIDQFAIENTVTHGGPTLVVRISSGRCAVTGYPITWIPSIARRRVRVVDELNEWLQHTT